MFLDSKRGHSDQRAQRAEAFREAGERQRSEPTTPVRLPTVVQYYTHRQQPPGRLVLMVHFLD